MAHPPSITLTSVSRRCAVIVMAGQGQLLDDANTARLHVRTVHVLYRVSRQHPARVRSSPQRSYDKQSAILYGPEQYFQEASQHSLFSFANVIWVRNPLHLFSKSFLRIYELKVRMVCICFKGGLDQYVRFLRANLSRARVTILRYIIPGFSM
jgi:hypothetical protein